MSEQVLSMTAPLTEVDITPAPHQNRVWARRGVALVTAVALFTNMGCDKGASTEKEHHPPSRKTTATAHPSISCEMSFTEIDDKALTVEMGVAAKGHGGVKLAEAAFSYGDGSKRATETLQKESLGNYGAKHEHTYDEAGSYNLRVVVYGLTKAGKSIHKTCLKENRQQVGEPPVRV